MTYTHTNQNGTLYYLHGRNRTLRDGTPKTIYNFSTFWREGIGVANIPDGCKVEENENGVPILKREVKR